MEIHTPFKKWDFRKQISPFFQKQFHNLTHPENSHGQYLSFGIQFVFLWPKLAELQAIF